MTGKAIGEKVTLGKKKKLEVDGQIIIMDWDGLGLELGLGFHKGFNILSKIIKTKENFSQKK